MHQRPPFVHPHPPSGRSIQPPSPTTRPTTPATLLIIHSHPKSPRLIIFVIAKEKSRKPRDNVQLYARAASETGMRAYVRACVRMCLLCICVRAYVSWKRDFFLPVLGPRVNIERVGGSFRASRSAARESFAPRARTISPRASPGLINLGKSAREQFFREPVISSLAETHISVDSRHNRFCKSN